MSNVTDIVSLERRTYVAADIDERLMLEPGSEQAVAARLGKELRGVVEASAAMDLNDACTQVQVGDSDRPLCRRVTMLWLPPANAPSELLGGSHDGREVHTRATSSGLPEQRLRMPTLRPPATITALADEVSPTTTFDTIEDYELIGFRNDSARWVYQVVA